MGSKVNVLHYKHSYFSHSNPHYQFCWIWGGEEGSHRHYPMCCQGGYISKSPLNKGVGEERREHHGVSNYNKMTKSRLRRRIDIGSLIGELYRPIHHREILLVWEGLAVTHIHTHSHCGKGCSWFLQAVCCRASHFTFNKISIFTVSTRQVLLPTTNASIASLAVEGRWIILQAFVIIIEACNLCIG